MVSPESICRQKSAVAIQKPTTIPLERGMCRSFCQTERQMQFKLVGHVLAVEVLEIIGAARGMGEVSAA